MLCDLCDDVYQSAFISTPPDKPVTVRERIPGLTSSTLMGFELILSISCVWQIIIGFSVGLMFSTSSVTFSSALKSLTFLRYNTCLLVLDCSAAVCLADVLNDAILGLHVFSFNCTLYHRHQIFSSQTLATVLIFSPSTPCAFLCISSPVDAGFS